MAGALKVKVSTDPDVWTTIGGGSFATEAETVAGVLDDRAVTPAGLSAAFDDSIAAALPDMLPFIDPTTYGLSTSASASVNRAALQAAIDEACGAGDPVLTTRSANRRVVIPAGTYNIDAPILIRSVLGLEVLGTGYCRINATSAMTSIFDINGMAYSRFGGLTITGSAQVDNAIYLYWDPAGAGRSSTNNSLHDIDIRNLDFVTAIRVGKPTMGNQVDNTEYRNINIAGGWTAGNTTRWQDGMHIGDGVHANNLLHFVYKLNCISVRYGINLDASQVAVYGAGFGTNEIDLRLASTAFSHFSSIRSEHSQRLMAHPTVGSIPVQVTLHDVVWLTNDLPADGKVIDFTYQGTLNISQLAIRTQTAVQPFIRVGFSSLGCKAIVNGLSVGGTGREGDAPSSTFTIAAGSAVSVYGYTRVKTDGTVLSTEDWESGGHKSAITLGNNARVASSDLILNAPSASLNNIQFNRAGALRWQLYDAGSNNLFLRDGVSGVMTFEFVNGTAALGEIRVGHKVSLRAPVGIENGSGGPQWRAGTATPEGAVTAPVGSLYSRTDGGVNTTLYVKQTGTGNTGWYAVTP